MKKYAYSNTNSDDLWREVEAAAGKPILVIAHDFTLQPGVPMLSIDSVDCQEGRSTVTLSQGEFTKDRPDKKPLLWPVPVIAKALDGEPASSLIEGGKGSIQLPGCGPVLLNAGRSGYYRSRYSPAQFAGIRGRFADLAPIDQLGLMGDTVALGMSGLQPASDILDLIKVTPLDVNDNVWQTVADSLSSIDAYYESDPARQAKFRAFAIASLTPV